MKKTTITVTTAQKLTSDQKKEIVTMLTPKLGSIEIDEVIDDSVISGLRIKVGQQEFDVTTQGKLKALESLLPQVQVISAVPLTADQHKEATMIIEKKMGQAEIQSVVDPEVIGGIRIIFPSEEYDGTIKGKINKLKAYMMKNI